MKRHPWEEHSPSIPNGSVDLKFHSGIVLTIQQSNVPEDKIKHDIWRAKEWLESKAWPSPEVLAKEIQGFIDDNNLKVDAKKISCKSGCSFCCKVHVTIGREEARVIAAWVDVHKISLDLERAYSLKDVTEAQWENHHVCPFLGEDKCLIYSVRPAMCRKYLVGSDPKYCDTGELQNVDVHSHYENEVVLAGYFSMKKVETGSLVGLFLEERAKRRKRRK